MPSEGADIRFLLDEHYPGWLADALAADGFDVVALTAHRPGLRGADDGRVLQAAVAEGRIIVTEDVNTFSAAARLVPDHVGIVYCHHARFPRTRPGLEKLRKALSALASDPPAGLGKHPIVWWLSLRIQPPSDSIEADLGGIAVQMRLSGKPRPVLAGRRA